MRPRQEVWDFIVDPTNDPRWCPKVKSVDATGPGLWTVTHKPVPFRAPIELAVIHVELDEPSRLQMCQEDDASVFDVEYRLATTSIGTHFTQVSDFEWKTLPRMLHKTFARGVRRDVRGQLRALKNVLEETHSQV